MMIVMIIVDAGQAVICAAGLPHVLPVKTDLVVDWMSKTLDNHRLSVKGVSGTVVERIPPSFMAGRSINL